MYATKIKDFGIIVYRLSSLNLYTGLTYCDLNITNLNMLYNVIISNNRNVPGNIEVIKTFTYRCSSVDISTLVIEIARLNGVCLPEINKLWYLGDINIIFRYFDILKNKKTIVDGIQINLFNEIKIEYVLRIPENKPVVLKYDVINGQIVSKYMTKEELYSIKTNLNANNTMSIANNISNILIQFNKLKEEYKIIHKKLIEYKKLLDHIQDKESELNIVIHVNIESDVENMIKKHLDSISELESKVLEYECMILNTISN